ncbi:hypothetical protein J2T58_001561 [Methanocalculus alkaliphilus]|nr:hypothetical protein [Methanocalculus alkaliphilus]
MGDRALCVGYSGVIYHPDNRYTTTRLPSPITMRCTIINAEYNNLKGGVLWLI